MRSAREPWLVAGVLVAALALIWLRPLDTLAERHVERGLQRALTTFAAARALNGVLSVVQSAQVGVGASAHPGALLEPVDDLVEQFSTVMLAATVSFATQHLLIDAFSAWPMCMLLSGVLVAWAVSSWTGGGRPAWLTRLAVGLLLLRLAVPVVTVGSEASYRLFLAGEYAAAQDQIAAPAVIDDAAGPAASLAERARRWWAQSTDIAAKMDALKARADNLVLHLVRLAAVFIVQTVVFPLLFLWLLWWAYRLAVAAALSGRAPDEN